MKLVIITGPHAVGKMTVGQELSAITGFKLLHNHKPIELVDNFFPVFESLEGKRLHALFKNELLQAVIGSCVSRENSRKQLHIIKQTSKNRVAC